MSFLGIVLIQINQCYGVGVRVALLANLITSYNTLLRCYTLTHTECLSFRLVSLHQLANWCLAVVSSEVIDFQVSLQLWFKCVVCRLFFRQCLIITLEGFCEMFGCSTRLVSMLKSWFLMYVCVCKCVMWCDFINYS